MGGCLIWVAGQAVGLGQAVVQAVQAADLHQPLAEEAKEFSAKGAIGGWKELLYVVENPLEPILFDIYLPKMTVKKLNAKVTFFIEDVTGAAQILQETIIEGITAAGNASPVEVQRRIIPSKDFTIEPERTGQRKLTVSAEVSAESATIPANTAKSVAYLQVLGLGRQ